MKADYTPLVERCRKNDRRAQRDLYEAFAPMAMGVCMRYVKNREEAQDVMQEGWVRVFERIGQLKDPQQVGGWIYRVMVNVSLRHYQRLKARLDVVGEEMEMTTLDTDPFGMEEVVQAMQRLAPQQRVVFNLVEVEGYSYPEVAERLGCSEVNVRALLSRAKAGLREQLKK